MLQTDFNSTKCNSVNNNNDLHKITAPITQNVNNSELLSTSKNENRDNSMSNTNLQSSEIVHTNTSEINSVIAKIKNKKETISGHQSDEVPLVDLKGERIFNL